MTALSLLVFLACHRHEDDQTSTYIPSEVDDPGQPLDTGTGGGDDGGSTGGGSGLGEDGGGEGGTPADDTGPAETPPDTRTFAMLQVIAMEVSDPSGILGDDTSYTSSLVLVHWERQDTQVTWTETLCDIEASEVFGTETTFPDAFIDTMPVHTRQGSLSAAETGATLSAGPFTDLVGCDLADPASDPLPEDPYESSVWDQDDDGSPGVTVNIDQSIMGEGQVYVAQRNVSTLDGVVVATDRIEGYLIADSEQAILGATTWWLELETDPPVPVPDESYFVMQQVDDGTTCDDIIDQAGSLF